MRQNGIINNLTRKTALLLICCFFSSFLMGQNISDSLLCSFANQALQFYFKENIQEKTILIESTIPEDGLITQLNNVRINYYSPDNRNAVLKQYLETSINNEEKAYSLDFKIISPDTIDVNINDFYIYLNENKSIRIEISCGGTMGYVPKGRFILDKSKEIWNFISEDIILKEKISQEEKFFNTIIENNKKKISND